MEKDNKIEDILKTSIDKVKSMISTSTIIGEPIIFQNKTLLPVTKFTMGFVSGGGEYSVEKQNKQGYPYTGGVGTGVNVTPIGFICMSQGKINFIKIDNTAPLEKFIEILPKIADSISETIKDIK